MVSPKIVRIEEHYEAYSGDHLLELLRDTRELLKEELQGAVPEARQLAEKLAEELLKKNPDMQDRDIAVEIRYQALLLLDDHYVPRTTAVAYFIDDPDRREHFLSTGSPREIRNKCLAIQLDYASMLSYERGIIGALTELLSELLEKRRECE